MKYEVISEIENDCGNNQMRDVAFEELDIADPDEWIAQREPGADTVEKSSGKGTLTYRVTVNGMVKHYLLTEI
ncbi:MAG: hypothetical protein ILP09_00875 [Oscillospiraceae bacterium]|nr:hypothetical protein [Oscillospiraceae bacterium]